MSVLQRSDISLSRRPFHALALACAFLVAGSAGAQTVDAGFAPTFDDKVDAIALQPDGRILVGGEFAHVNGSARHALVRLLDNGSIDPAFVSPSLDGGVNAIAVQPDGRILVAGDFTSAGGATAMHVVRLQANGSVDAGFASGIDNWAALGVEHLVLQADGRILIAGGFGSISGQPRERLARLLANGSVDSGFLPPALDSRVDALVLQPSGAVVIAGSQDEALASCAETGYCIARLNASGAEDTGFGAVDVVGSVRHMALDVQGRILLAGGFGDVGEHATSCVARLHVNGGADIGLVDTTLRYSTIENVVPQADGGMLIGGAIRWGTSGKTTTRVARLTASGARDTNFTEPVFDSLIYAMTADASNRLLVGGLFTAIDGTPRQRLARIILGDPPDPIFSAGFE